VRLGAANDLLLAMGEPEPGNWRPMSARYDASEPRGARMSIRSAGIMLRPKTIV
jgi:hypothetical protein